jgi:hypothetical protein
MSDKHSSRNTKPIGALIVIIVSNLIVLLSLNAKTKGFNINGLSSRNVAVRWAGVKEGMTPSTINLLIGKLATVVLASSLIVGGDASGAIPDTFCTVLKTQQSR